MNGNKNHLPLRPLIPPGFGSFLAVVLLAGCCRSVHAEPIDFSHQVVPILREHCVACHGGDQAKGGFSINTRESFLEGEMAEPGSVDESYFLELVSSSDPDMQMPPQDRKRVDAEQVALLRAWIRGDMPWEEGFTFGVPVYEPPLRPRRPALPPVVEGRSNPVDRCIDAYLIQQGLPRPEPLDDAAFLRRVHLDLVGLLPEPDVLDAFLADDSPDKRGRQVRELLDNDVRYAEHWLTFWNDLLRNDYAGTGFITGGRRQISSWLYEALVSNLSFDQFARQLIAPPTDASRGYIDGIKWRGDVSAGQTVEIQFAQSISQSFLGINMKCASCHDSFIDRWTLHEAYGLAAIYASDPLQVHRCDKPTGDTATASWLFPELGRINPQAPQPERLQQLADLMTHPENGRFTRTVVNRLWHQLMGRGIVHPLDAMQTEPWNADLLDYLAWHLQENGYDLKQTLELIATSQAYQSIAEVVDGDADAQGYTYRGPRAKRLTAEQFVDAIWQLTGSAPTRFDAPVTRGSRGTRNTLLGESPDQELPLRARWIWASAANEEPPAAGETLALRTTLLVDRPHQTAGAVITCDNEYTLYVNGQEFAKDSEWTSLEAVSLTNQLKVGENTILVIARNAGAEPNAAGLLFEARVRYPDGYLQVVASGESWQALRDVSPQVKSGKGPLESLDWQPVQILEPVEAWSKTIDPQVSPRLAEAAISCDLMVRAALLSSDFLMRSLGRPNRDQIVSTRPSELTTLEAIDLSNSETLAGWLLTGGASLSARSWEDSDPNALVVHLFRATLARDPSESELQITRDALGPNPSPQAIADVLWAICMTPDFLLVR